MPHEYYTGILEGNHAHYILDIQEWKDGAADCPARSGADPDQPRS